MRSLFVLILFVGLLIACKPNVVSSDVENNNSGNSKNSAEAQPSPTPFDPTDINGKIGLADLRNTGAGCLRTKNGNLSEGQPIAVIISLDEPPQKVISASIAKKLEQSCARRASETGDHNPGKNYYYELKINDPDAIDGFDVGIAVAESSEKLLLEKGSAHIDLDGDGEPESFRECSGNEGMLFTIWNGKPLLGKRIWGSFYYVDYDTVPTCTDKDSAGFDEGDQ